MKYLITLSYLILFLSISFAHASPCPKVAPTDLEVLMKLGPEDVLPEKIVKKYDTKTLGELIVCRWVTLNKVNVKESDKAIKYNFMDDADLMMQIPSESIEEISSAGFQNYHQVKKSHGSFLDVADRIKTEDKLMQLTLEKKYSEAIANPMHTIRPKYGYLNFAAPIQVGSAYTNVLPYGDVTVVFKNEVKKRTTWTYDDSLQNNRDIGPNFEGTFYSKSYTPPAGPPLYTEAQIYGELSMQDVSHFVVPENFPKDRIEALKKIGLPIYEGKLLADHDRPSWFITTPIQKGLKESDFDLEKIEKELAGKNVTTRREAARLLVWPNQVDDHYLKLLEKALENEDYSVRRSAILAVGQLPEKPLLQLAEKAVNDSDPLVRTSVARMLRKCQSEQSLKLMEKLLSDSDSTVLQFSAESLGKRFDEKTLDFVEKVLENSKFSSSHRNILMNLAGRSDKHSLAIIKKALTNPDQKYGALKALSARSDVESLELIEKYLQDPSYDLQRVAADALIGRTDEASLPLIEKYLNGESGAIKASATKALAGRSDQRSLEIIEKMLKDSDVDIRKAAVIALRGRKEERVPKLLTTAINDDYSSISDMAKKILSEQDLAKNNVVHGGGACKDQMTRVIELMHVLD